MVEEEMTVGFSRELIIHPGETLEEILEEKKMSQKELAIRTAMTEKHISTIINRQKHISPAFAKKLEYALGIEAIFWLNLQSNYERELIDFEDINNITKDEYEVLSHLKEVIIFWQKYGFLEEDSNHTSLVLSLRKVFCISNLSDILKIKYLAAFRVQNKIKNIDPFVLFAWQRTCELLTENIKIDDKVNTKLLRSKIPDIKEAISLKPNKLQNRLSAIFAECGIIFKIVPSFKGAPVQGFIKKRYDGSLILCITVRQKFADIFWFTLFHEIAHILNGDINNDFIDIDSISEEKEIKADKMAEELLINPNNYKKFVMMKKFNSNKEIHLFAKNENVEDFIVKGRLMRDKYIPWNDRLKYELAF